MEAGLAFVHQAADLIAALAIGTLRARSFSGPNGRRFGS